MYGPPSTSELKWPKGRIPLEYNMKLWRDTVQRIFCGISGINPDHLENITPTPTQRDMTQDAVSFKTVLAQYEKRFTSIISITTFGEDEVQEIISLLKAGKLYAGGNGSEKDGRG